MYCVNFSFSGRLFLSSSSPSQNSAKESGIMESSA